MRSAPKWTEATGSHLAGETIRRAGLVAALLVLLLAAGGCAMKMEMGRAPLTDRLSELSVDVSTDRDIRRVLGEPQGIGAVRSPAFGLKEAWLYELTEMEGSTARMRMMMVFLDRERRVYQGHMWFASGLVMGETK